MENSNFLQTNSSISLWTRQQVIHKHHQNIFFIYPLKIYSVLNSILEDNKNMDNVVFNLKKNTAKNNLGGVQQTVTMASVTTDPDNGFSYLESNPPINGSTLVSSKLFHTSQCLEVKNWTTFLFYLLFALVRTPLFKLVY